MWRSTYHIQILTDRPFHSRGGHLSSPLRYRIWYCTCCEPIEPLRVKLNATMSLLITVTRSGDAWCHVYRGNYSGVGLNDAGISVLDLKGHIGLRTKFAGLAVVDPHETPVSRAHSSPQACSLCPATFSDPHRRSHPRVRQNQLQSSLIHLVTPRRWKHH